MALLTPKDIREHTFQTVRFKEGYDVIEVDDFLDQVTQTVEALAKQAVQSGQSTESLGPDVTGLNNKIAELSAQVQSLEQENQSLKANVNQSATSDELQGRLNQAEDRNRALTDQNEQLKNQVGRLSEQIDQLTAQAAKDSGNADLAAQLNSVQQERDGFKASNESLTKQLQQAQAQLQSAANERQQLNDLNRQLEESRQRESQLREQLAKVEPAMETGSLQKIAGAGIGNASEPERATAMLTLAMQLHDQYVDKGKAQAKEIYEESQKKYQELITKANDYSNRTRSEADAYSKKVHEGADTYRADVQRSAEDYDAKTRTSADRYAQQVREKLAAESRLIEGNIQGLKQFETEYRARLTEFLSQLVTQVSDTNKYDEVEQSKS